MRRRTDVLTKKTQIKKTEKKTRNMQKYEVLPTNLVHFGVDVGEGILSFGGSDGGVEGTRGHEGVIQRQTTLTPLLGLMQQLRLELLLRFLQILTRDTQHVLERHLRTDAIRYRAIRVGKFPRKQFKQKKNNNKRKKHETTNDKNTMTKKRQNNDNNSNNICHSLLNCLTHSDVISSQRAMRVSSTGMSYLSRMPKASSRIGKRLAAGSKPFTTPS